MWPYIRKTESVAELKMKFTDNQNVKNGIGVSGRPTRTPQTSTSVANGKSKTTGMKHNVQAENSRKVSTARLIYIGFKPVFICVWAVYSWERKKIIFRERKISNNLS